MAAARPRPTRAPAPTRRSGRRSTGTSSDAVAEPAHDQAVLHGWRVSQRCIGHRLHVDHLAPPPEPIRSDEQLRLAVRQAAGHRRRPVAREDGGVHRPQLPDSQDRDHRLGNHGHEDPHPVISTHAKRRHRPGGAVHLAAQLCAGEAAHLAVLPLPDERLLVRPLLRGPVHRRRYVVESRADPPTGPFRSPRDVEHGIGLRIETDPEIGHRRRPEPGRIGLGSRLELFQVGAAGIGQKPAQPAPLEVLGGWSPGRRG